MKYSFKFIAFAILLLNFSAARAIINSNQFDIRHIGYAEGLSSQRVFSIVEDRYHAIWISTKEGVDRYNGQNIKKYTLPGTLYYGDMAGRAIRLLHNIKSGLWTYDNTGRVYHYSEEKDKFNISFYLRKYIKNGCVLNKFYIDKDGSFWFCTNYGLFKKVLNKNIKCLIPNKNINDIIQIGTTFYIGTSYGIYKIIRKRPRLFIKGVNTQTLYYDYQDRDLWIGTFNNGLFIANAHTPKLRAIKGQNTSFYNPIRAITYYDKSVILIGIDGGGVYAVDKRQNTIKKFMDAEDVTSTYLRGNGIYAVTKDSQGNIWIGSYTGGISALLRCEYPIRIFVHQHGNYNSLRNDNVNKIIQNTNGDIWFANDLGISIRKSSGTWCHILNNTVVVPLCKGINGCIWAGTYGKGVYLLDRNGNILLHLSKGKGQLSTNYILAIKQDLDGNLWIGGLDGSLLMIKKGRKKSTFYNIRWSQSIEIINKDNIAISTVSGFYVINKRNGKIVHYLSLGEIRGKNTSIYIDAMQFNNDGTVWLGTEGGGLNLYNMHTHKLKTFTTHNGLPSNDIYSLQYDGNKRLWISTGKGLAMIVNNRVSNLNFLGNVDNEYNKSSSSKFANGEIAFGSSNGAVLLSPDILINNKYNAPLRFTGITVDYSNPAEENYLQPEIFKMLKRHHVKLNYSHNSFNINFEAINYRFQRDIVYQYILDGYDKHWSNITSNGFAQYSHVASGYYTFKVRCMRCSDNKVISENELRIDISQPWWNSMWAWLIYITITSFMLYFILKYKNNQLQKKYDEDKISFFTHTAHDIRTPVTLIMAPLEDLEHENGLSEKVRDLLNLARNNTQKLYSLITQLLDFEKFDIGQSHIHLEQICLNDILSGEFTNFIILYEKKHIKLNLHLPDENIFIMADKHLIEMALDNILSNAYKYTQIGGDVHIIMDTDQHNAYIEIKDNGIGISKEAQRHIFKEVYRDKKAIETQEIGTGFGLLQVKRIVKVLNGKIKIYSEENAGSTFKLVFKRISVNKEITSYHNMIKIPIISNRIENKEPNIDNGKSTILIIEDNEDLRNYLFKIFSTEYHVIDKANGQEALSYLKEEYPDLILSDVMMPGIQGDELCNKIKNNPDTSGIPFILLTAKVNHEAVVTGLKRGADDYISKPFNTEILKLKVKGMIENRNRLRNYLMHQVINKVENVSSEDLHQDQDITMSEYDHQFVLRATQIVMDNIDDTDFSINILCQEMAMSRTLFYSRLKSLTGKGPQEFIRIIRLQKAAKLLKAGKSVNEVAADTGFINTKYFSSLFKKHFGVQPSRYI